MIGPGPPGLAKRRLLPWARAQRSVRRARNWAGVEGMEYFVQQLINGVALGSIYGLIAIGYTMVYGIIGMINFAHGDIFMIGAFISLISFLILGVLGVTWVPLALLLVLVVAMLLTRSMAGRWRGWPTGRCAAPSAWPR